MKYSDWLPHQNYSQEGYRFGKEGCDFPEDGRRGRGAGRQKQQSSIALLILRLVQESSKVGLCPRRGCRAIRKSSLIKSASPVDHMPHFENTASQSGIDAPVMTTIQI